MSDIGNREIFAKNLRFYLERTERTQREVALAIGVTPASLNEWLKEKKYPRIDKIEMLANYFGILKSDLIEDKGTNRSLPQVNDLTKEETMLLDLFRQISPERQAVYLALLRGDSNQQ